MINRYVEFKFENKSESKIYTVYFSAGIVGVTDDERIDSGDPPLIGMNPWTGRGTEKPDLLTCRKWKPRGVDARELLEAYLKRTAPFEVPTPTRKGKKKR